MNFGFVMDNRSCIGCHACSTACKSEHQVPVGVQRTWVRQTEVGEFPDVRRSFQVNRCNHCANPPCVRICPTGAMFQRDDGIVEFDSDACIGCKGCTQACPYDAIYIDPESHTAAKCNFCAHRVDVGLEPACVVVCPEHAIVAGDLDDPLSEISRLVSTQDVTVRRPEQGTGPKVFYIDGHDPSLHPTAAARPSETGVWSDIKTHHHDLPEASAAPDVPAKAGPQGIVSGGPLQMGGSMAGQMIQVTYEPHHAIQWHWYIPAYLVTKHIAGGVFMFLAFTWLAGMSAFSMGAMLGGGALGLLMLVVTLGLLVADLDRPDRFFYLLVRPQWRSWIARAAWILSGFFVVAGGWWLLELCCSLGWLSSEGLGTWRTVLAGLAAPLGLLAAVYTAFLFGQCEGRDLWQGAHLPVQMAAHAFMLGGGAVMALGALVALPAETASLAQAWFFWGLVMGAVVTLTGDLAMPHATDAARLAARDLTEGRYRQYYWYGGIALGYGVPLVLLAVGVTWLLPFAFVAAGVGLFAYAYGFVMAAQQVPNS